MATVLRWSTVGSWLALVGLWLLYVAQRPAPVSLSRTATLLALAATVVLVTHRAVNLWRRGEKRRLAALAFLVTLALALYLPGIRHEVGDHYYADEGIFRSNATAINNGQFLRQGFLYPHLLFYADAFAIWIASLFHPAILSWSDSLYGISDWHDFCRLVGRLLTALAGALTVVPVFLLAERLAGSGLPRASGVARPDAVGAIAVGAGLVAGLLIAAASHYHAGSNLHTADVPSAFFAMCCLACVGRLLRRERARDYLAAGAWAGLAAGTKYPAGVVAIAIVAVWVRGRIRERNLSWGLPVAGISALATFLATSPSLVVYYRFSLFGDQGAILGARQYTSGRWIGVAPDSHLVYYLELIGASFGWLAVAIGAFGLFFLGRKLRADVAWLLPFPLVFLGLLVSMSVTVERSLYPALPPIAVLLGTGLWALVRRLATVVPRPTRVGAPAVWTAARAAAPRWAAGALIVASVGLPLWRVTLQEIGFRRESTRQLASSWIYHNLPHGSRIFKERYTPNIHRKTFEIGTTRWIGSYSVEDLRGHDLDYVILSATAYQRFLDPELHFEPYHATVERNYRDIFERLELIKAFEPGPLRRGPLIQIYRVAPD